LSIAAVPVFVASLAIARDTHRGGSAGATSGTARGGFMGQHTMTGTVTDIDKDKGTLTVDADGQNLALHFPKTALQNVNKGDRVAVQLGIKPAAAGTTSGMGARQGGTGMHKGRSGPAE